MHPRLHRGFPCRPVGADRLSGESPEVLAALLALALGCGVAMRAHRGALLGPGQRGRDTAWNAVDRGWADGTCERRDLGDSLVGQRRDIRDDQLTPAPHGLPEASTWLVLTTWSQASGHDVGTGSGLRPWIESGFRPRKPARGWPDFRGTSDPAIERWGEMAYRASLLASVPAAVCIGPLPGLSPGDLGAAAYTPGGQAEPCRAEEITPPAPARALRPHNGWHAGKGWQQALTNLRLLIPPFMASCLLSPGLESSNIPALPDGWGP
jgi:hypothetical protein